MRDINDLVTVGDDNGWPCIFIGGLPMYHGPNRVMVDEHAKLVKEVIVEWVNKEGS